MIKKQLSTSDYQIFLYKTLIFLFLVWGGFACALAGFFYAWLVWGAAIAAGIVLARHAFKKRVPLKPSWELVLASLAALVIVVVFSLDVTPTVFSGRDQGSFSEAAIRLAQNHKLEFSTPASDVFFKLHEPGRAQNFPGFYYTPDGTLLTQFSLGYIVWLALFYGILGLAGLAVANAVLMFVFLLSFYLLLRLFLKPAASLPAILFAATSFVFMWFSKYTLSENMALPLVWLMILALMLLLKKPRRLFLLVFFASAFLLCFTRIEGFALLFVATLIILFNTDTRHYLKKQPFARIFLPMIIFLVFFLANAVAGRYFYREIAKALLPSIATAPQAQYLGSLKTNVLPDFYTEKIFYLYGVLGFFIVGALSALRLFWKKEFYKLAPILIISPTLIYFFDAHITTDHPWLLRRFMITLLPGAIFYSGLLVGKWLENAHQSKRGRALQLLGCVLTTVLLVGNLPAFSKYLFFSENRNLLEQAAELGGKFSKNDLVLIDREATGDGWAMIGSPLNFLYGKNTVYFFNTADLARLDTGKFENVYLIAPNQQTSYYRSSTIGPRLTGIGNYELSFSKLASFADNPLKMIALPEKTETKVQGEIFKIEK